nr:hypothetical protein [Tanacetum cinerariifolium]
MASSTKALIVENAFVPTPPSPPPSLLYPLSYSLIRISSPPPHTSPTYASAALGYIAAIVQLRAASPPPVPSLPLHVPSPPLLLPSANRRSDIPRTDMPFRKRLCLTAPTSKFKVVESSTADAAAARMMTTVEEVNEWVTNLATIQRHDAHELYVRDEDAQDDQDLLRSMISLLTRERGDTFSPRLLFMSERLFLPDRFRELAHTRDAGYQDRPADAGSSC